MDLSHDYLSPWFSLNSKVANIYFRYTAAAVLEMDFDRIDINQCPPGEGNKGPNRFADTARCKKETTEVSYCSINISK